MHNKNELFCSKCLIHDTFFIGGGSWSPSNCPKCKGTDCIIYENLSFIKKLKTNHLFDKMWLKKYGN